LENIHYLKCDDWKTELNTYNNKNIVILKNLKKITFIIYNKCDVTNVSVLRNVYNIAVYIDNCKNNNNFKNICDVFILCNVFIIQIDFDNNLIKINKIIKNNTLIIHCVNYFTDLNNYRNKGYENKIYIVKFTHIFTNVYKVIISGIILKLPHITLSTIRMLHVKKQNVLSSSVSIKYIDYFIRK